MRLCRAREMDGEEEGEIRFKIICQKK